MKKFITLLLLNLSLAAFGNENLIKELRTKAKNFEYTKAMYENLKTIVIDEDDIRFCEFVKRYQVKLKSIYTDDYNLNQELIRDGRDFTIEYSKKIYTNSASDLFSINNYKNSCENNEIMPLSRFLINLDRSLDNNHILHLSHSLFMQIFLRSK